MADQAYNTKLTPPRCGAQLRGKPGTACKKSAMKNGRCRLHGGLSTGVPGNTNGLRHGFYYNVLSAEEQAIWADAKAAGSGPAALEDELALMRIKLQRLLRLANNPALAATVEQQVDVIIKAGVAPDGGKVGTYEKKELKASLPHVGALIVEAVETIRKLSLSISQLKKDEKELLADQQDNDTEINVNINVVGAAPAHSLE